eukprot:NODE_4903_length_415_cov_680.081967_g3905_i0.p1 GENE.NODE_4903_length_415_cov_680.081967_g3905_i0~~NODE_4903_length_415_cov_680.081967_g3905_i0.p1  ORF type:complete len:106 (+),score=22.34 NODE_4903_length_415_cov_680.081967_g3905_i0:29-319(+)
MGVHGRAYIHSFVHMISFVKGAWSFVEGDAGRSYQRLSTLWSFAACMTISYDFHDMESMEPGRRQHLVFGIWRDVLPGSCHLGEFGAHTGYVFFYT